MGRGRALTPVQFDWLFTVFARCRGGGGDVGRPAGRAAGRDALVRPCLIDNNSVSGASNRVVDVQAPRARPLRSTTTRRLTVLPSSADRSPTPLPSPPLPSSSVATVRVQLFDRCSLLICYSARRSATNLNLIQRDSLRSAVYFGKRDAQILSAQAARVIKDDVVSSFCCALSTYLFCDCS